MPLRCIEALSEAQCTRAAEIAGAFPAVQELTEFLETKLGALSDNEIEQVKAAFIRLQAETGVDAGPDRTPAAPSKAVEWFSGAPPSKRQARRLPTLPSSSASSVIIEKAIKTIAPKSENQHLEMIYAVYLEIGADGTKWLQDEGDGDTVRRELILRPLRRQEPKSLRSRLSSLRRWRGFAEAIGGTWQWFRPPTLTLGTFLMAAAER